MSQKKTLYQCKSNDSRYESTRDTPMYCNDKDAWAGVGYYFWDSFIDLAHFWGKRRCNKKYIIAKAEINMSNRCFDVYNTPEHMLTIKKARENLTKLKRWNKDTEITFCAVITFLKDKGILNDFEAIRFLGRNSVGRSASLEITTPPVLVSTDPRIHHQDVELCPPIQFCLFRSTSLGLKNYKIVFDSSDTGFKS